MATGQSALLDHVFGGNKALYEAVGLLPLVTVGVYGINYAAKSISSKFAKKATQEIVEETAERLARESIEEAAEKAFKEAGEEASKKTAMEAADNTDQINTTTQEVAENQNSGVYLERGSETSYGKSSKKLEIVKNVMKEGEMSSNGRRITYQLDNKTRIIFGLDLGENAHPLRNHGYMTPVNHMNIEIQTIAESGNVYTKWDMHMILNDENNVVNTLITGPWKDW